MGFALRDADLRMKSQWQLTANGQGQHMFQEGPKLRNQKPQLRQCRRLRLMVAEGKPIKTTSVANGSLVSSANRFRRLVSTANPLFSRLALLTGGF